MSTEGGRTSITAPIRPHMEGHVVRAQHDLPDFPGFAFDEVRGKGRVQGGGCVPTETDLAFHQYPELRLVCRSERADDICGRIASAPWTGRRGNRVVWTTPVHSAARIRGSGRRSEKIDD